MKQYKSLIAAAAVAILTVGFQPAKAQEIINTPDWNSSHAAAGTLGNPGFTPTFGQVFTVPTDGFNTLTDFQFEGHATFPVTYDADLYAWNGSGITGSALFTSSGLTLNTGTSTPTDYNLIDLNTGSLTLTGGNQYVMVLTVIPYDEGGDSAVLGYVGFDDYGGGQFVFNNATTFSGLSSGGWSNFSGSSDLDFQATFAAPEPSTWAMMLGGLAALGFVARRKTCRASLNA